MLGGLIVSDYEMPNTSRVYMATIPYDYYDRYVDSTLTGTEKEDARFDYMESSFPIRGEIEHRFVKQRSWEKKYWL